MKKVKYSYNSITSKFEEEKMKKMLMAVLLTVGFAGAANAACVVVETCGCCTSCCTTCCDCGCACDCGCCGC